MDIPHILKDNIVLLAGNSNIKLAKEIAYHLEIPFNTENIPTQFSNTEIRSYIKDDLRGKHIYIVQSGCVNKEKNLSINDMLFEILLLIDACRRSNASTVNLIIPCFPYARGDKKDEPRAPIPAKIITNIFGIAKVDRIISMDLHAGQIQGFTDKPFDNLYSISLVLDKLNKTIFKDLELSKRQEKYIVVSPDVGAAKRTLRFAKAMKLNTLIMHKQRDYSKVSSIEKTILICESETSQIYKGKTAILCDDIADTCGTLVNAVNELIKHGIKDVICVITHGIFSKNAIEKINDCKYIKKIYVSDSIPQETDNEKYKKIETFTISKLMADVIYRILVGKAISELFVY